MAATTAKKAWGWWHFSVGWSAYTLERHFQCLSLTRGVGHATNEAPLSNFDNCASDNVSVSVSVNGSASIYGYAYCCCRCAYKCKFKLKINRTASACRAVSRSVTTCRGTSDPETTFVMTFAISLRLKSRPLSETRAQQFATSFVLARQSCVPSFHLPFLCVSSGFLYPLFKGQRGIISHRSKHLRPHKVYKYSYILDQR